MVAVSLLMFVEVCSKYGEFFPIVFFDFEELFFG